LLDNEDSRYGVMKEELADIRKRFGDARQTEIEFLENEISIEDLIEQEDVVITVSHLGYIKRTSATEYRAQRRGGRGAMGGKTRNEDYIDQIFVASTHDNLLLFTDLGRCYWLKVYELPDGEKVGKGRAIQNLLQLPTDDKIRAIINVHNLDNEEYVNNHFIVLCTKEGIIKKTRLKDFSRRRATGVNAITINEGDKLIEAALTDGNSYIMMAVQSGRSIRFPEEKVRPTGRGAIGVSGIEVISGADEVVGMVCIGKQDVSKTILVVSEKGLGKRTDMEEYRITNRGGKGVKTINITEKTGKLVGLLAVEETDDLMITCTSGVTIRMNVSKIREAGRATQGVKLINLDEGDEIAAIAKLAEQEEVPSEIEDAEIIEETPLAEGEVRVVSGDATPNTNASNYDTYEADTSIDEEGDKEDEGSALDDTTQI
jgi:DNA gyrase subunit A